MFSTPVKKRATRQSGSVAPFGLPVRGMNTRDPVVAMPPGYAVNLVNVIVDSQGLRTRKGYHEWAINLDVDGAPSTAPVHSIMVYYPAGAATLFPFEFDGNIFAAKEDEVFDVTAGGEGPWAPVLDNQPGPYWTSAMFQNDAGAFLVMTNDLGGYRVWDGATWNEVAEGTDPDEIEDVDPDDFVFVMEFKERLWFVEKDSTRAWYLPAGQLYGKAVAFDFGPFFRKGGALVALANWTVDGGMGIDDQLVAVSSQGDVVIYQGSDPASPTTFQLKGVWSVGPLPAGRRQLSQRGGDVVILSHLGATPVSKLLALGEVRAGVNLSFPIDSILSKLMERFTTREGWQLCDVPKEELFLIGVPLSTNSYGGDYFSYRLGNDAWSILRDTTYTSMKSLDGVVIAGSEDGRVFRAFYGFLDNVKLEEPKKGFPIICTVMPSFQSLNGGNQMSVTMLRPTFLAPITPNFAFRMVYDYGIPTGLSVPTFPEIPFALWDEDLWDVGVWSGMRLPIANWLSSDGVGFAASPQMKYACGGDTILLSIDLWQRPGGVL